ncbi:helix-turn-helix transcriptional regulator [Streptomyces ovatisporus]|uniref:Helix-turn-helix transcriptional regulator n=1 Tax=Streptomyces ovatisporus TaxID=1128682 RepID=A0ABV9A1X3_9ACTN
MTDYEFLFVVEGVSAESDLDSGVVFDEFDGLLASHRGRQLLTLSGDGAGAVDAAHRLSVRLRRALPAVRLLRLDPDLVGVADIAERTGRSRQNVLQWIKGERRSHPPFPEPEGTAGRSLVWRWGEVNAWLRALGEGDDVHVPLREEALAIDVMLPQWQKAMDEGRPVVAVVVPQDDRTDERVATAQLLHGALQDASVMRTVSALPRMEQSRLVVACALPADKLGTVLEQIATADVGGLLATRVGEGELKLIGVASRDLPGTRPISELGLSPEATVGDLLLQLAQCDDEDPSPTPLAVA